MCTAVYHRLKAVIEYWNTGVSEYWNTGILEYRNTGILGDVSDRPDTPLLHYSITPVFDSSSISP